MLIREILRTLRKSCPTKEAYSNLLLQMLDEYNVNGLCDLTYNEVKEFVVKNLKQ